MERILSERGRSFPREEGEHKGAQMGKGEFFHVRPTSGLYPDRW